MIPPVPAPPRTGLVETLHGTAVADPFRPIEDDTSPEVLAWVEAQRLRTRTVLDGLPLRAEAEAFLRSVWYYPRRGLPMGGARRSFEWRYDGRQPQGAWWVKEDDGEARLLLDPNEWSAAGTVSVGAFQPSPDGSRVAYTRHAAGSDWSSLHVLDVDTGQELPDRVERTRWGGIAWLPGSDAFLYTLPPPEEPNRERVHLHRLGEPTTADPAVFATPEPAPSFVWCIEFPGGAGAACYASRGTDVRPGCWTVEPDGTTFRPVVPVGFASLYVCHREGGTLYAVTDHGAPRGRLVALDLADPAPDRWRTVVPEGEAVLEQAVTAAGRWALRYAAHGWNRIDTCALDGSGRRAAALPGLGIGWLHETQPGDREVLYGQSSLARPASQYRLDPASGAVSVFRASEAKADLSDCTLTQVFVTARNGVRIPLTLIHRPDLRRDGKAPAWLYSYGGYAMPSSHGFSFGVLAWVRKGGVYAIAGVRGGSEEGEDWHRAAMGPRRQVAFDDFQDCAVWLAQEGYCSARTLGIQGGSNGGLLVAACLLQRPDLFGAVLCDVPTTDMLRFHLFTVGAGWVPEYGSPDDPEAFRHLLAYSPVHNVRRTTVYPPVMVSTADHDDRVVPMHSYKMAAALQETPSPVVLLRVERDAGHWAGASTEQVIARTADQHAFLWTALTGGFAGRGR